MRFLSPTRLRLVFLVCAIMIIGVTVGYVRTTTFASSSLLTSSRMPTVVFSGFDTNGYAELWATTGTANGTIKLTNITTGTYRGLDPHDITPFGNQALFEGTDANGLSELWMTDGIVVQELTGAFFSFGGLSPYDITVLGNQAVFAAQDGHLWITDGTGKGTHQVMNIANVSRYGLDPTNITTFGKQALFNGYDASGNKELWVTDGTTTGTKELTTVSTNPRNITVFGNQAAFTGTNGLDELWVTDGTLSGTKQLKAANTVFGLFPEELVSFGNQVLFTGFDASGNSELWVTNGTSAGTTEVTTTKNGFYSLLSPSYITPLGNKAVFQGYDPSGHRQLWATDGVPNGSTIKLTSISNNFGGLNISDMAAFGNQALFSGFDGSGNKELWITNGTLGGTNELTGVPNVDSYNLYSFDITPFGAQAVFNGVNVNSSHSLWVTNGTPAGTHELSGILNARSVDFNPSEMTALASSSSLLPTPTPALPAGPSLTEYMQASDAAYSLDKGPFIPPSGMTPLMVSPTSQITDGFEAVALIDANMNIIIANEGTVVCTVSCVVDKFARNSLLADLAISKGLTPPALVDAIVFAKQVQNRYLRNLYVTGHSLGGIEAEAEAQALQANFAGGATFGATGLPGNKVTGVPTTLIDYVDYGDPVGNYASDLNSKVPANMYHYGKVVMEGPAANAIVLRPAAVTNTLATSIDPYAPSNADASDLDVAANLVAGISEDHPLKNYAADLGIHLTLKETVAPAISLSEFVATYGGQFGTVGISDAEATTLSTNGTLVSPDTTLSYNATTDQIIIDQKANIKEPWGTINAGGVTTISFDPKTGLATRWTYVSPNSLVYNVALNSSETVTVVQVNPKTGGSYQIIYDTSNSQAWSSYTNFYKAANNAGGIIESVYNWRVGGGSQVLLFTGLPRGKTEEIKNYSGPNGTGRLLSTQFK